MKKYLFSVFIFVMFFCGFVVVDAETYVSYEVGDKISVNVSDGETKNFYVISNSDKNSSEVTAVYEDVLGEKIWFGPTDASLSGSFAEDNLKLLTVDWKNPTEIRLLKSSEVLKSFVVSVNSSENFDSPSYFNIGKSYWTQDVVVDGGVYYPILVTTWNTYSNIHTSIDSLPEMGGYIRPVITISKDYVIDEMEETVEKFDYVVAWQEFIKQYQKTEFSSLWNDEDVRVDFDYTDTSLTITMTDVVTNEIYVTNFTYEDGFIKYVPLGTVSEDNLTQAIYDQVWIINCIYTISDLKGYDVDSIIAELEVKDKSGLIYTVDTYSNLYDDESGRGTLTLKYATDFQLDIEKGIILDTSNNPSIDNPKTDISFPMIGIIIIIVGFGCILLTKNKKYLRG